MADTSFLVFRNEQQQEYLGARTNVLDVNPNFDLARDYYINFHEVNPEAPQMVLGMPLLPVGGAARAPGPGEVLVASGVADYVGIQPGAEAIVELVYSSNGEPIVRRFDGLRLIGTFDLVGPDQGRFDPFWRFNARGQDVLTVRSDAARSGPTTLPIVLNPEVIRNFLSSVRNELEGRGGNPARPLRRDQLVVRARTISDVPAAEAAVEILLRQRGLDQGCEGRSSVAFCLLLPERNNFRTALREQMKVGSGGAFFVTLLLVLVAVGTAGLQVQTVVTRWRDYGVLQAPGFTPGQMLVYYGLQLASVLAGSVVIAAVASLLLTSIAPASLILAAGLAAVAAAITALPVLFWPLWRPAAELLRDAA